MVHHIRHEKNWCLDKNFDQKLIHSSQIDLKHQMSISTQAVPKTTSKYLPFGTNLVSVAQFVQKWEQFKEKLSKWQMFVKKQFGYDDIYFRACSKDQIFGLNANLGGRGISRNEPALCPWPLILPFHNCWYYGRLSLPFIFPFSVMVVN